MASGDKEHKMLFDIRGKRRNVVKAVYAVLAVLMGLSLFLVTGIGSIGSLFDSGSESNNGAQIYEEQAERIEGKLVKSPEDPELLLALTRAQLNAGNQMVETNAEGQTVLTNETIQMYQQASGTWSEYLKATKEPSPSGAQLIAPTFVTLAEAARSAPQFEENMDAAAEAAEIVAKQRPSVNSLSTLSYYQYFAFNKKAAERARAEAAALSKGKIERERLNNALDEYKKRAEEVEKQFKELAAAEKAAGNQGGKEKLENPFGGLGGTTLGE
jgi:hypothetical protein